MNEEIILRPSSEGMRHAIQLSREAAIESRHAKIGLDDLMVGVLRAKDGRGAQLVEKYVDSRSVEAAVRNAPDTRSAEDLESANGGSVPMAPKSLMLTATAEEAVKQAHREAVNRGAQEVGTEHLLMSILGISGHPVCRSLAQIGLSYDRLANEL